MDDYGEGNSYDDVLDEEYDEEEEEEEEEEAGEVHHISIVLPCVVFRDKRIKPHGLCGIGGNTLAAGINAGEGERRARLYFRHRPVMSDSLLDVLRHAKPFFILRPRWIKGREARPSYAAAESHRRASW